MLVTPINPMAGGVSMAGWAAHHVGQKVQHLPSLRRLWGHKRTDVAGQGGVQDLAVRDLAPA